MENKQEDFKSVVENLITNLRNSGVSVDNAAILKLDALKNKPSELVESVVKKTIERAALAKRAQDKKEKGEILTYEETCKCDNCLNFSTFENVFKDLKGKFDYTQFTVGGKVFKVKYWSNGEYEHMLIDPMNEGERPKNLEELQVDLNIAINAKDYALGQVILDRIQQLKNQS